ncbi:Predicted methyltransferase regulatory domain-containing protein [Ectothiorhodospira magna]|uniref:Predicted methyltransferase regulatory domain-containing protein n=1 Tax=Ectothiorhodospira magna TaxID=867345 RepID=A0A1H9GRK0_9GAMM|nr:class I SAM-dependent methyltransferase [Ectothiorhodospira magna]SEQ52684.1 Predicted methyltransferase regulatory domain-containing protein [Ectothiorhodospira magna]
MTDWTAGYVSDIGYTYGYYTELNPLRLKLAFLNAGIAFPEVGHACELGFGQGLSTNLHAAASTVQWHGTDFNPAQAGFAQELAQVAGSGAALFDQSFEQFCRRDDLPEFDYIGLHGIWSWISDENRQIIVDFLRCKLKVGGVLYISYNTQPGWAAMVPMRDLLTEHADVLGAEGVGIISRIDSALSFAEQLLATNPAYARANPQIAERIERMKGQNRNYLAHEYFNRDWSPMSVARMADWLAPAKLNWACSANTLDAIDAVNLTGEQQQLLVGIPDAMFRQSVRDFCVNQQFRKDYWVKGARPISALEQAEALREQRVVLVQPRPDVSLKVTGSLGEATMQENVYGPILDQLADHKPKRLGQLEQSLKASEVGSAITFAQLLQATLILSSTGALLPVQDESAINKAKKRTERLNHHLMKKARSHTELSFLASPVTGGGIQVSRFHQLFLLARSEGHKSPNDWATYTWNLLAQQGQRLIKEGQALENPNDNLAELTRQAQEFADKQLPIFKALQIA